MSVVVSGGFCRFKLALPSLLLLAKDEVKTEHFAGNERFLPAFPSSVLSGYALNKQTGHGR